MPVRVLIAVTVGLFACLLFVCLLFAADRTVKVMKQTRRRREASRRLAAAAAGAEAKDRQRQAAQQASVDLTSVMPTIHDVDTRHVE